MNDIWKLLDLMLTASHVRDSKGRLDNFIDRTKEIESFDASKLVPIVSLQNMQQFANAYYNIPHFNDVRKRWKLFDGHGCFSFHLCLFSGCHNSDVVELTTDHVVAGLSKCDKEDGVIVFDITSHFKGSATKQTTILIVCVFVTRIRSNHVLNKSKSFPIQN